MLKNNRQSFLGGTDIGVIAGVNPYRNEKDLYLEKTGQKTTEVKDNINMKLGRYLEAMLLNQYVEKNGIALETRKTKCFKRHPKYKFLASNIDGLTSDGKVIVEAKTTRNISSWKGGIPKYYKAQVAHYANIWDVERVDFVVFDLSDPKPAEAFYYFTYQRDKEYEKQLEQMGVDWWTRYIIENKTFISLSLKNDVKKEDNKSNELTQKELSLSDDIELLKCKMVITTVKSLKETVNMLEIKLKTNEQILKDLIGTHEYLVDGKGNKLFSYKIYERKGGFDTTSFKDKHSELYLQFQKEGVTYRRLTINN